MGIMEPMSSSTSSSKDGARVLPTPSPSDGTGGPAKGRPDSLHPRLGNPPKAFLTALILFVMTVVGVGFYLYQTDSLPAPMLSNRFSFDEKMRFMRLTHSYDADVVVLGSSTGINNFLSDIIVADPRIGSRYFNFSAWGMTTHAVLKCWHFIKKISDPKVLILPIDLFEFQKYNEKFIFNEKDVLRYLSGANPLWYYVKCHKSGMMERIRNAGRRRRNNNNVDSMKFDENGGVALEIPAEHIKPHTPWQDEFYPEIFYDTAYEAMEELLTETHRDGIVAVIVQSPLREPVYDDGSDISSSVQRHWAKVDSLANKYGAFFLNMQRMDSIDRKYFVDSIHLNREGAALFTEEFIQRMDRAGAFKKIDGRFMRHD